ncbi:translocation and assembly module lipoprotein TamL [Aestuariivivens sediminicola]|uniref:translocation and assembly module lipoprotein TamL n=1 Tax=Aestuariivivens sediminicola TaxID=2913560 RepID=UPI001F5A585A|nr:BamA/TamA family outer membrane protein [Aestuariivivens sediminicola]
MKLQLFKISITIVVFALISSCDAVKRVSESDYLLTDNTVVINDKKDNSETIANLISQKPNRKILGVPLRLHLYNTARPNIDSILQVKVYDNAKKMAWKTKVLSRKQLEKDIATRKGFNSWLKRTGEAPVIWEEEKTRKSVTRLQNYHINNGWFDVTASYTATPADDKRIKIQYEVNTGPAFIIDSITKKIESPLVELLYEATQKDALVKTGAQYRTVDFEQERNRISTELRNRGLFRFGQEHVSFEIDTIGTNKKVNVGVLISNQIITNPDTTITKPFKIFKVDKVNIYTDDTFATRDLPYQNTLTYNGYHLYSHGKMRYRPKAITDAVFIAPKTIFRDIDRTRSYRYLNELRTFKYPEIKYVAETDSSLIANVYLTPLKKFSLGFSAEVSQSNIQSVGLALNPSLQIRNIFRGAETFEISAITSVGASKDKNNIDDPFFDINEYGIDLRLRIPRLFSPFNTDKIIPKYMSPSTRISLSTTSQTNIGLDRQTFTGNFNYNWSPSNKITNNLDLFNVQYVRNLNVENYFRVYENSYNSLNTIAKEVNYIPSDADLGIPEETNIFLDYALNDPTPNEINSDQLSTLTSINERKNRLTENNLIFSTSFGLTRDVRTNLFDEDFSIFRFRLELAGNMLSNASKLLGLEKDENDRYEIFNVAFSQYVKTEFDYIKHWDLGKKNILAMRTYAGIAIPYGNSTNIPFSKSFFAGGANDNRAWTAYSLGPGSSESRNEFNEANFKLALGIEQRFNLFEDLNAAIFIDAGNIWNVLDDVEDDKATFTSLDALKDIAIGSGFGLRYDFSFFVFRFDIGFKTYDPSYTELNRWFRDYNFSNAVYNIGINYPF